MMNSHGATWQKSTYSDRIEGCVEVAELATGHGVRDSKNPNGAALQIPTPAWIAFVAAVTADQFV